MNGHSFYGRSAALRQPSPESSPRGPAERCSQAMKRSLLVLSVLVVVAEARADEVAANPNDPGAVTSVGRGVKEIDLGGIFVLSVDKVGDESTTKLSTLGGLGFQFFLNQNVSLGATGLFSYDKVGDATSATSFGGVAFGSLHVRLGLGAFFRPT